MTQVGRGLGVKELRTDSGAHKNLVQGGFRFPDGWEFGGGSLETHLGHLLELSLVVVREVTVRGGRQRQYLPKSIQQYIRLFHNQEVTIPTQAIGKSNLKEIQIKLLWGDEVRHVTGTPNICSEPLKLGGPLNIRGGHHRLEVPGSSALYGSPSRFWNYVSVKQIISPRIDNRATGSLDPNAWHSHSDSGQRSIL